MKIAIHGDYLGTSHHLIYDGKKFSWTGDLSGEEYIFGSRSGFDLRESMNVFGKEFRSFDDTSHAKAIRSLAGENVVIPWFHAIPSAEFKRLLSELLDDLWGYVTENMGGYYIDTLRLNRELLDKLERPLLNIPLAKSLISKSSQAKAHDLSKFLPNDGSNFAPKIEYNLGGSVTGRLTVSLGPNILTLKRSNRKILKSRFPGGNIVQVDISSLEPRIALSVAGKSAPDDIYSHVSKNIFNGELTRSHAKQAILTCIYGGSSWTIKKNLPDNLNAENILRDVKRYFEIDGLNKMLESEIVEKGFITNLYGRRINSGESLVNHFLQSTGVDVSLSVFRSCLSALDESCEEYVPLYVIHDAIVLDVSESCLTALREICANSFQVDNIECKFPVKVDIIS